MPLNPNGKIDKPALPFPDTVQAASIESRQSVTAGNPTEQTISNIWSILLPNPPHPLPLDESFFDMGGHSILATRLIFEMRKIFVIDAPLGLVFDHPTISGLASAVDNIRQADLGIAYEEGAARKPSSGLLSAPNAGSLKAIPPTPYGQDFNELLPKLRSHYESPTLGKKQTIFLTGATGFLGAFILRELLLRSNVDRVICLVRAHDKQKALARLREGSTDRNAWDEQWVQTDRLQVVPGDLGLMNFGLSTETWLQLADSVDVIVHNGALVSADR